MIRHTGKPLITTALSSVLFAGAFTGPALAQELIEGHLNIIGSASFMPLYAEREMPFWTQTLAEVFSVTSN